MDSLQRYDIYSNLYGSVSMEGTQNVRHKQGAIFLKFQGPYGTDAKALQANGQNGYSLLLSW